MILEDILFSLLENEKTRQQVGVNLIASENYMPKSICHIVGSVLANKYVEGYPGARYYSGCHWADKIELETIDRFKKVFQVEHANVQPHSGSQANLAVYFALLKPGDTILSMKLSAGGHLTHGHAVSISGKLYKIVSYGIDEVSGCIDYQEVLRLAIEHKPSLIIAGASSYSRVIDFKKFSEIAKMVGSYFMADIAHIAGLVATGLHPSPADYADVITLTTHKTFRGPRGAVILCKSRLAASIDRAVMPGIQGGAFMNVIAAKGLACALAESKEFLEYQQNVLKNSAAMAQFFIERGYKVVSGGTDTHLFLVDLQPLNLTGKQVEQALEAVDIFVNRNVVPLDKQSALVAGGIRIGTAAITSRGATMQDCLDIGEIIHQVLEDLVRNRASDHVVIACRIKKIVDAWLLV